MFSVKSTWALLPCLQISLPFTGHERVPVICLLMSQWKLLNESNNTFSISSFILKVLFVWLHITQHSSDNAAEDVKDNMSRRSQGISTDVPTHVIEQLCSFSSGQHDTWMAMQILTFILKLIDSHQSCWARCITFPGSLKSLSPPSFFFKLDMLCWKNVFAQMRAVALFYSWLLKQSCLYCDTSAFVLSGCGSLKRPECNLS